MRAIQKVVVVAVLGVGLVSMAWAAKRPDAPRPSEPGIKLVAMPQNTQVAPLEVGAWGKFAMMDAWMNSTWEPDMWTTNYGWCNNGEELHLIAGFTPSKLKPITATVVLKDPAGKVLGNDSEQFEITTMDLQWVDATVGQIPEPGTYKIIVKFKQGNTTIGQSFWFTVLTPEQWDQCIIAPAEPPQ